MYLGSILICLVGLPVAAVAVARRHVTLAVGSLSYAIVGVVAMESAATAAVAVESVCGLVLCVACMFWCGIHTSLAGALRIVWIAILVTSANTYSSIQTLTPERLRIVPNDVTIVTVAVALTALVASVAVARATGEAVYRSASATAVEFLFVVGACALRFGKELFGSVPLNPYFHSSVGRDIWHLVCWVAVALTTTQRPRRSPPPEEQGHDTTQ